MGGARRPGTSANATVPLVLAVIVIEKIVRALRGTAAPAPAAPTVSVSETRSCGASLPPTGTYPRWAARPATQIVIALIGNGESRTARPTTRRLVACFPHHAATSTMIVVALTARTTRHRPRAAG